MRCDIADCDCFMDTDVDGFHRPEKPNRQARRQWPYALIALAAIWGLAILAIHQAWK